MDFNNSSESFDNVLKSTTKEKDNARPTDFISSASEEKTTAIDFNRFSDSNDRISDYNSDGSFHSIETDEDDLTDSNIKTVNGDSNESADDSNNDNAIKSSFISQSKSVDLICGEENVEKFLNDDAELVFSCGELKNRENPGLKSEESNISTRKMSTENEDAPSDDFFDEPSKDSSTNTGHHAVENSVRYDEHEKSHSNDDAVETNLSHDTRTTDDDRTSIVDEVDESFSLDEILEESECSDRDQTQVNCTNDEHLTFDEDSMASIEEDNSKSVILENGDESAGSGKHQSCRSPSNNESVDSHEVENYSVCQEFVQNTVTVEYVDNSEKNVENSSEGVNISEENVENNSEEVNTFQETENNSENAGENFLPVSVPCPDISPDNEARNCEVSPYKSQNEGESPSKENSLKATAEEAETIDSSGVTDDLTIEISSKCQQSENSPNNHHLHSSVDPLEDDQNAATEDSICPESSTKVPDDNVLSSHGESAPVAKLTDTLSSDAPNEKEAFRENDQTAEPSSHPEEDSFVEELASDSTQELLRNLRRRVSSRRRNVSEGEPSLSDAGAHAESDSSMLTIETRNRTNNHRSCSKSTSRSSHSRSNWQPKINDVMSASSNFSIRLEKFPAETAPADVDIKEEVIDESYGVNYASMKRFNLVDFSIKLEKIDVDSDVEIISSPRKSRPDTRSRSRNLSEKLRNRMRSRTAAGRSAPSVRKVSGPSATTTGARRAARNQQRDGRSSARGAGRVNGQMAKSGARQPADGRRLGAKASSKMATRRNVRSLRSAATNDADGDRIHFLSMFNLRSRQETGDETAKGILVKPKIGKRSKRVSFQLPSEEVASTSRNSCSSKAEKSSNVGAELTVKVPPLRYFNESSTKSTVRGRSVPADRKRTAASTRSNETASTPAKRSRSKASQEREDEVIDENPFKKLESLVDVARKTVDVWFECQCCNQKYYLLENTKQHVRTHFPNCLTN